MTDQEPNHHTGWRHVKVQAEPLGQWAIVNQVSGTGYGPTALAALKLPPMPTAGLDRATALALGAQMEQAMAESVAEPKGKSRRQH